MITISNTLFVGKVLYELEAIGSTNQYALELLSKSKPSEGAIVLTHDQYAGRGQVNKHWESEPGKNLTISLILYPTFLPAKEQFFLNEIIALGVLKTIEYFVSKKCSIKWPNDIYVENRKITGILIQNALKGSTLQSSVVGIGINVNQQLFTSDAPNPTSIYLETGKEFILNVVLNQLCQQIEKFYLGLKANRSQAFHSYFHRHLYRFKEWHLYQRTDNEVYIHGMIVGVTATGLLQLETTEGIKEFALKEIRYMI